MKKIALVVLYFGKLPNYFDLWLWSCRHNPTVDFLLFTDDSTAHNYPPNVKVSYTSFEQTKARIQSHFDFPLTLTSAYKLCDYKPAYGLVFQEELITYDFWGHCDIDLIWGDIRQFITEDILQQYDRILPRGHFSLYRNNPDISRRFLTQDPELPSYREVFSDAKPFCFDEWPILSTLWKKRHWAMYVNDAIIADIKASKHQFIVNSDQHNTTRAQLFVWTVHDKNGKLYRYWIDNDQVARNEFMYIHLQKRRMVTPPSLGFGPRSLFIIPNEFVIDAQQDITIGLIKQYKRSKLIYRDYWTRKLKNLNVRIIKWIGGHHHT
ncbi:DUF6625 family protein [Methylobacillus sp.]|uniref:DUF6625 family protein n=1 Tax=Methylobacillus sp. TaxID=56818 RepID=UPI002FE0218F